MLSWVVYLLASVDLESMHYAAYFSQRLVLHPGNNDCAPNSAVEVDSRSRFTALKPSTFKL